MEQVGNTTPAYVYLHLVVAVDGQRGWGWDGVVAEVKWFEWA